VTEQLTRPPVRTLKNFVGGAYVDAEGDSTTDLVDPSSGRVVAKAPVSGPADVDRAYQAAAAAFEEWGQTTPSERQAALLKFADAIESRADELVHLEAQNTGKPFALTASEEIRRWSTSSASSPGPPGPRGTVSR
jgi:betaine-aldehyde dehydrogenase